MNINTQIENTYLELIIQQYQNQPTNQDFVRLLVRSGYNNFAYFDFETFFDIDNQTGGWLDRLGELFDARRTLLPIAFQTDNFYRLFIKFKIIALTSNFSITNLSSAYHLLFGENVILLPALEIQSMVLNFKVVEEYAEFIKTLYDNSQLPLPAGCQANFIIKPFDGEYFAMYSPRTSDIVNGNITISDMNDFCLENAEKGYIITNENNKYIDLSDLIVLNS